MQNETVEAPPKAPLFAELQAPLFAELPWKLHSFWIAAVALWVVAVVAGFMLPQILSAGVVTKTETVVKKVSTTLPPVSQAGADIGAGRPCDVLSNSTDPNAEFYIHCPAKTGEKEE